MEHLFTLNSVAAAAVEEITGRCDAGDCGALYKVVIQDVGKIFRWKWRLAYFIDYSSAILLHGVHKLWLASPKKQRY